ncbi:MAG: hypothetical protein BWK79_10205 [Beggiatoa sp. IS2]|nr:MAG: hypothetical protein BWK79_10205 [Beggiatoa sp. IS2]
MEILKTLLLVTLMGWMVSAWAGDPATSIGAVPIDPNCLESREVCEKRALEQQARIRRCAEKPQLCEQQRNEKREKREQRQKFCAENPEVCKQQREEREALEAQCKAQPEQCAELKKQFHRKKAEEKKQAFDQWCTHSPQACEQWKAESEKIREQCAEMQRQLRQKFPDMP